MGEHKNKVHIFFHMQGLRNKIPDRESDFDKWVKITAKVKFS